MMDFFRRVVERRGMPPLPDDDETIEARWPKFPFVANPTIRAMQRKCLMRAEHIRAHPELYPVSLDDVRRERMLKDSQPPKIAGESSPAEVPFDFTGIEATAPVSVRRHLGEDP